MLCMHFHMNMSYIHLCVLNLHVLCVVSLHVCAAVPCCFVIKSEIQSNFPYFAVLEVNCRSHAASGKLSSILSRTNYTDNS